MILCLTLKDTGQTFKEFACVRFFLLWNAFMSKHICISGWATWIMVVLLGICQLPSAGSIGSDICVKIGWQGRGREGWNGHKRLQPVPKCYDPQRPASASRTTARAWLGKHSCLTLKWGWEGRRVWVPYCWLTTQKSMWWISLVVSKAWLRFCKTKRKKIHLCHWCVPPHNVYPHITARA